MRIACWQKLIPDAGSWNEQVASEAAMRAPEEVYKGQQQGAPKAAEELSREERTRLRAKKKRAGKKQKLHQVLGTDLRDSSHICCSLCPLSVRMLFGMPVPWVR